MAPRLTHRSWPLLLCCFGLAARAHADTPPPPQPGITRIEELSLEDLLNVDVQVATQTTLTQRDAPGVITVVSRDEIVRAGARDLLDILTLVPGFSVGLDLEGVIDVGFRGNWGHEGKVLFLLDGQELNEIMYANMELGMHIPAAHIERLEITRGPGSAVYGGYAELAVVDIITRDARSLDGVAATTSYSQMESAMGRFVATASWGQEIKQVPGLGASVETYYGRGNRSDQLYTDFSGASYSMAGNSTLQDVMVNVGLHYRDLKLRFIYDDYRDDTRDGSGPVLPKPYAEHFEGYYLEARSEARLRHHFVLTPKVTYKKQTPWQIADETSAAYYNKTADRLRGGLTLAWDPIPAVSTLVGAEAYWDHGHVNDPYIAAFQTLFNGQRNVDAGNFAGYAQVIYKSFIANVTGGVRYEYNSGYGSSFVPRVGLTKVVGRFNFKLLYSQAFRAPGLENVNINPRLQAEHTNIVEAEVGVQAGGHMALTVNGYWLRIDQPIVYDYDKTTGGDSYLNATRTGTAGVEADWRLKYSWGFVIASYSFYSTAGQNDVRLYAVPGHPDVMLAFPAHKAALNAAFDVWRDHLTLAFSGVFMSERYGYLHGNGMGVGVLGSTPNQFLVNGNLAYHNLGVRGLDVMLGVYNLLNTPYAILQAYNGGHAPLPMASREVLVQLSYNALRH